MRIMLQLEYASSLYLSPAPPFSDMAVTDGALAHYPEPFMRRMLANYSTPQLHMYRAFASAPRPKLGLGVRLRALTSRVKRRLIG
jgi:hypothetical protein